MITVLQLDKQFGGRAHERRGRAGGHTGPPLHVKMETSPVGANCVCPWVGRAERPGGRALRGASRKCRRGQAPALRAAIRIPRRGGYHPPSPYRKLLPKLNSACFPKRAGAFGSPAGGSHILGGSKFRLRQGFAGRNAWTPHGGGSLRSQEQAGRRYRKLLPKLNSACSLVSSPMV